MPQLSIISFFFQGLCFVLFLFIAHLLILKYVLVPLEKKLVVFKNLNKILVRYNIFQNVLEQFEMSSVLIKLFIGFYIFFLFLTCAIVLFYSNVKWTRFIKIACLLFFGFTFVALLWQFFITDFINIPQEIPQQSDINLKTNQFQIKDQHENVELKKLQDLENDDLFIDQLVGMSIFTSYALTVILTLWGF